MSRSAIFLALIAISAPLVCNAERAEPTPTQERELFNVSGLGLEMRWRVSQEKLEHSSQWNTRSEPPLSAAQALTKARSYLASHGQPSQLPVTSIELRHVNEAPPTCFFYLLQFGEQFEPENGSVIVMLLDGSVVVPVTTHPDAIKSAEALPSDEILRVIGNAKEVYVFPYTSSAIPKQDDKHLRALDLQAQDALKRLLGDSQNWFEGFLDVAEPLGVRSVGALFRNKSEELVLFFDPTTIWGRFRGRWYSGGLTNKRIEELERWKERYASVEMQGK
jgi:hypothetical protein